MEEIRDRMDECKLGQKISITAHRSEEIISFYAATRN